MTDKRFYVTIEVKAQLSGDVSNDEIRRRVINYIHNEKQKENHVCNPLYLNGLWVMSVCDGNVNEL